MSDDNDCYEEEQGKSRRKSVKGMVLLDNKVVRKGLSEEMPFDQKPCSGRRTWLIPGEVCSRQGGV